ncbi:MAG: hypothetical protein U5K28_01780 [Halobacteriales archaeon]|nr:hypothetical protein [Halobacteriales archaeon]
MDTTDRRTILTVCGTALAGALAGCNNTDDETSTATETDVATPTATETPKPTATPRPTDPEVMAALVTAQPKAATAFEHVQALQVVEDGQIGATSDDQFREFAIHDKDDVYDPLTVVRDTLVPVREQGSETQRVRVETLLSFGEYVNTKYQEYTALAEGFTRLYRGVDAYAADELTDAYDYFTATREDLASISEQRVAASELLEQFATDGIDLGIRAFSITDEQAEQTYVSTLVYRWVPGVRGMERHVAGMNTLARAIRAFEAADYERVTQLSQAASGGFEAASEALSMALDRDVSLFPSMLDTVACRSDGLAQSAATLRTAGRAGVNGDERSASARYETADSQFKRAFRDCEGDSAS